MAEKENEQAQTQQVEKEDKISEEKINSLLESAYPYADKWH